MILLGMSKEKIINDIIDLPLDMFQAYINHLTIITQNNGTCIYPPYPCTNCPIHAYGNPHLCTEEVAFSKAEEVLNEIRISTNDRNLIARKNSVGRYESIW